MKKYTIQLSSETAIFYERLAETVGFPVEKVLRDALFRLAGELSMEALSKKDMERGN